MSRTLTAHLQQPEGKQGYRKFELFDGRFLRVRIRSANGKKIQYAMDVAVLSVDAREVDYRPWHWAIAAGGAGAAFVIALLLLLFSSASWLPLVIVIAAAVGLGVLFARLFLAQSRRTMVFYSRYAGVPLVEILIGKPTTEAYGDFLRQLSQCSASVVQRKELTAADLRAGELRTLRKMKDDQILAEPVYEQAKQQLLAAT